MTPQPYIAEPHRRLLWAAAALFGVLAVAAPLACAQESAPAPPAVDFTVSALPDQGKLICVPVNKSVLVDFNVPVREVQMANPEIADFRVTGPRQVLVSGKSFGTTQLVAWVDGDQQALFDVAVDIDLERLQASIRSTVPRARVEARSVLDTVVLSGHVPDAEAALRIMEVANIYSSNVVNHMRVAGVQQVLLRCTVAEVNKTATRQLGFNGWMAGDHFRDAFAVSQLGGLNPVNIGAAGAVNAAGTIPFATDQNGLNLTETPTLSIGFPRVQMQVFIQALRENGLLKILAEPNLVSVNGQEASFLAGGEFPVPVPQRDSVTIEYREFGVQLRFTPTVLSDNTIRLHVAPEVSEPDYSSAVTLGGFVVPGLIQRKVDTVVELGPGQTFALGGLLSERTRGVSRKVPLLGDIPVLGALFSSVEYQSSETELVVLVTPELVEPLTPDQVAYVPGSDLVSPNDAELFMNGELEGRRAEKPVDESPRTAWPVKPGELYGTGICRLRGPVGPAGAGEGG
ncbi:MAG: type II and III secretion system protein family protein [Phycisphaerae bacterium]|jgi:pilus assembly protein CpaC